MSGGRKRRGRSVIAETFIMHRKEMRESPAWWALPDEARRVLDRLEIEHMRHGGAENGHLLCRYEDFIAAGMRRTSIALAVRQCEALGFVETKRHGYRTRRTFRAPSLYRLTYVNGCGDSPAPTDDWRRVASAAEARRLLSAASNTSPRSAEDRHPTVDIDSRPPVCLHM